MSDALLGRIATALEALVAKGGAEMKVVAAEVVAEAAKVTKPRGRKAVGEENGVAVVPQGATPGVTTAAATGATTPAVETTAIVADDPFDIKPATPAKPLELTDVRAALIAYQKAVSPEAARQKLKTVGGVDSLASLTADKFQAVVDSLK